MHQNCDLDDIIAKTAPDMQALLNADGFALGYGTKPFTCGETPTHTTLVQMCGLQAGPVSSRYFLGPLETRHPLRPFAMTPARFLKRSQVTHSAKRCGFKACRRAQSPHGQAKQHLVRPPNAKGCPHDTHRIGPGQQERVGASPKAVYDRYAGRVFSKIDAQLQIKHDNDALHQFTQSAAHDLKAPIRRIGMALQIMRQEHLNPEMATNMHSMAEGSVKRLSKFLDGLLEIAVIGKKRLIFSPPTIWNS